MIHKKQSVRVSGVIYRFLPPIRNAPDSLLDPEGILPETLRGSHGGTVTQSPWATSGHATGDRQRPAETGGNPLDP